MASEAWLDGGGGLEAWLFDENQSVENSWVLDQGDLPFAWDSTGEGTCVLILPGSVITSTSIIIPKGYLRRHRQALPWLFEDLLLGEPSQQHVAVGNAAPNGEIAALVVSRTTVADVHQRLAALGLKLDAIYSEVDLLPAEEGCLSVLERGDQLLFRMGGEQAVLAADAAVLPELLSRHVNKVVNTLGNGGASTMLRAALPDTDIAEFTGNVNQYLAARAADPACTAINLLQQEFAPQERSSPLPLVTWLIVGLCSCLLLVAGYLGAMAGAMERRAVEQREATAQQIQTYIPRFRATQDVRRELTRYIEARLTAQDTRINFPEFISVFSTAWQQSGLEGPIITSLRFSRPDAEVQMDIDAVTVPEAERLQGALREGGLASNVVSANASQSEPDKSLLRLRISVERR